MKKEPQQSEHLAVHCIAGLSSAPLLVAIALIHLGCPRTNAINIVKEKRKGALNMN